MAAADRRQDRLAESLARAVEGGLLEGQARSRRSTRALGLRAVRG